MRAFPRFIAFAVMLCTPLVHGQLLWRGIDADGVPVFSDRALPDVRALPAPPVAPNFSTITRPPSAMRPALPQPSSPLSDPLEPEAALVTSAELEILNPKEEATIRNNRGEISVDIEFSAQIADKILRLQLWLDGQLALEAAPDQRSFLLRDVPRGAHQLEVRALHPDGTWRRSPTHTVYLHRASRLH